MRTARLLTVYHSIRKGGCPPRGCHVTHPPIPPRTEGMTDACENINFPQLLLRVVIISLWALVLINSTVFSYASAKVERSLSSLSCVCVCM